MSMAGLFFSCNFRVEHPHVAVFSTVDRLMRGDSTKTGFFTNTSLYDSSFAEIEYQTENGNVFVKNDGTQNFFACRYDTANGKPIWIAAGGGSGGDGGCNYYEVPPENSVYIVGYFEGTARFPIKAGSNKYKEIISNGLADMFIAKYSYDQGVLQWVSSGGSPNRDVVFYDNLGARHKETILIVDSSSVTVYANFFGVSRFDNATISAKESGSAIQISYDKRTGKVKKVDFVISLPRGSMHSEIHSRTKNACSERKTGYSERITPCSENKDGFCLICMELLENNFAFRNSMKYLSHSIQTM